MSGDGNKFPYNLWKELRQKIADQTFTLQNFLDFIFETLRNYSFSDKIQVHDPVLREAMVHMEIKLREAMSGDGKVSMEIPFSGSSPNLDFRS